MLTARRLRSLLDYDPITGMFTWRVSPAPRVKAGSVAGSLNNKGRRMIQIDRKLYVAARLVWLHVYGHMPDEEIDHKNRIRSDDRLDNLRPATTRQNCVNRSRRKDNTSGHRGVTWNTGCQKWIARIVISGTRKHLGVFDHFDDAVAAYQNAAEAHYGEFAVFDAA